ncbi:MAG: efflux RND transporter periplasmic adaptor subunit [Chromatiales bacterium]|nr:efflux RND transporter periplasmic adaptor subunit [Chromatiales bacterium]
MNVMPASNASPVAPVRRLRRLALPLLALLAVGVIAYFLWPRFFGQPDLRAQYLFATVQRGDVEDVVTAIGTLQPRDYVDVGAQVSGQLNHIHVEVGDEVKTGDLLAEIDPTVAQSRVEASRAQLRNQRAQLMARESDLLLAESQLRRQQNLMAEDATTAEALQNAEAAVRSAKAQIEALKAQIEQSESNLREDEANLNYTRIEAPMAGTVVSIAARQGQTLNAAQQAPTILRIADLSTMTVQTQVSEADVSRLTPGMEVYFTTLGDQTRRWYGKLRKIEPTPEVVNNVVLYNALFDIPNPRRTLMTQMTAQVYFVVAKAEDALVIPMAAVTMQSSRRPRPDGSAPRNTDSSPRPRTGDIAPNDRNGTPDRASGEQAESAPDARTRPGNGERPPRRGTVKLLLPDGNIEERSVGIGVTNRVQAQVLEGLEEGVEVVTGQRRANNGGGNAQARPGGTPPRIPR